MNRPRPVLLPQQGASAPGAVPSQTPGATSFWSASDEARLQNSREWVALWTGLLNKSLAGVPLCGSDVARCQYRKLIAREHQIIAVMEARKEAARCDEEEEPWKDWPSEMTGEKFIWPERQS